VLLTFTVPAPLVVPENALLAVPPLDPAPAAVRFPPFPPTAFVSTPREPALSMTPLTLAVPPAPVVPVTEAPPVPPPATSVIFSALEVVSEYAVAEVPSVELALPPAPALPLSVAPPNPPVARCVKVTVPVV
jgi:hypothetical protein